MCGPTLAPATAPPAPGDLGWAQRGGAEGGVHGCGPMDGRREETRSFCSSCSQRRRKLTTLRLSVQTSTLWVVASCVWTAVQLCIVTGEEISFIHTMTVIHRAPHKVHYPQVLTHGRPTTSHLNSESQYYSRTCGGRCVCDIWEIGEDGEK